MSERRIEELWRLVYADPYLSLPRYDATGRSRNEQAEDWLRSLSIRPHVRFARLIEKEGRP